MIYYRILLENTRDKDDNGFHNKIKLGICLLHKFCAKMLEYVMGTAMWTIVYENTFTKYELVGPFYVKSSLENHIY